MNRSLALSILGCDDDPDDIEEAWEDFFFRLKNKLLTTPPVIKLLKVRQKEVRRATEMEMTLFDKTAVGQSVTEVVLNNLSIVEVFDVVERSVANIKLEISSAANPVMLESALSDLISIYTSYYVYLELLADTLSITGGKPATPADPFRIKHELITVLGQGFMTGDLSQKIPVTSDKHFPIFAGEIARLKNDQIK